MERTSFHEPVETTEISRGAGTANCAARPEHRNVQMADRGGRQTGNLVAPGVLQHSSLACVCASASPAVSLVRAKSAGKRVHALCYLGIRARVSSRRPDDDAPRGA